MALDTSTQVPLDAHAACVSAYWEDSYVTTDVEPPPHEQSL